MKTKETLSDRQQMAILMMVYSPEMTLGEIAQRLHITKKTMCAWQNAAMFAEALKAERAKRMDLITDSIKKSYKEIFDSLLPAGADIARQDMLEKQRCSRVLVQMAEDPRVPDPIRLEAAKVVMGDGWKASTKVVELCIKAYGDNGASKACVPNLDPETDPTRPANPEPRPGVDAPMSKHQGELMLRAFGPFMSTRPWKGTSEVPSPEPAAVNHQTQEPVQ